MKSTPPSQSAPLGLRWRERDREVAVLKTLLEGWCSECRNVALPWHLIIFAGSWQPSTGDHLVEVYERSPGSLRKTSSQRETGNKQRNAFCKIWLTIWELVGWNKRCSEYELVLWGLSTFLGGHYYIDRSHCKAENGLARCTNTWLVSKSVMPEEASGRKDYWENER